MPILIPPLLRSIVVGGLGFFLRLPLARDTNLQSSFIEKEGI